MLYDLFPTPIWVADCGPEHSDLIDQEISAKLDIDSIQGRPWDDLVKSSFEFQGTNDLQTLELTALTAWIMHSVQGYCQSLGYQGHPQIVDSWFNRYDQGDFMYDHCHPGHLSSGVYYHRVTEGQGNLRFVNPNPLMLNRQWPADLNPNCQGTIVTAQSHRLILFPAWLTHRVEPNTVSHSEPRISLAFNLR